MSKLPPTVILTLFSIPDPISPAQWQSHLPDLLKALHSHLPISPTTYTSRFLDRPSSPSSLQRVYQLHIPSSPVDQHTCTSASRFLAPLLSTLGLAAVIAPLSALHKSPLPRRRLAVFDMDSTLIRQEVIDELARAVGVYDAVSAITDAAMRGDPNYADFAASLRARVGLLKGVEGKYWDYLREEVIQFTDGAGRLIRCLKSDGWTAAVLSGGFVNLAEWVKDSLGLDYAFANRLETDGEGRLTGRLEEGAMIVDGERKRLLLGEIAEREGVDRESVIAVGDGSNDLPMMGVAGLGIAFNAKPKVQERAPAVLNAKSLTDVLYILGWTEEEIDAVE